MTPNPCTGGPMTDSAESLDLCTQGVIHAPFRQGAGTREGGSTCIDDLLLYSSRPSRWQLCSSCPHRRPGRRRTWPVHSACEAWSSRHGRSGRSRSQAMSMWRGRRRRRCRSRWKRPAAGRPSETSCGCRAVTRTSPAPYSTTRSSCTRRPRTPGPMTPPTRSRLFQALCRDWPTREW